VSHLGLTLEQARISSWPGRMIGVVDRGRKNRQAWDVAAQKYVEENEALIDEALTCSSLLDAERAILQPFLDRSPVVVHLQSGMGLDDLDLAVLGASLVVGVDFSVVTSTASLHRSQLLGRSVSYVTGDASRTPLQAGCADLVYTGKGALMWLSDLDQWTTEVARLLVPGGHLFMYEAHPAACLWTLDEDTPRIRADRSYFNGTRINDTFPASAIERFAGTEVIEAVEWQWTLADIVSACIRCGLEIRHLAEHPEPFWKAQGTAAAWDGRLPNSFSLLARRRS
jgi:SAM-dependent methyltransferase